MQRWFAHSNWEDVQNLSAKEGQRELSILEKNISLTLTASFSMCSGKPKEKQSGMICVFGKKIMVLEDNFVDWPQCVSSAPFSQSFSLSQVQLIGMQRPLGQAKKLTGHLSFLLSARQQENIMYNLWQFKKSQKYFRGEQSTQPGQFLSSEKSPQSLLPSHTHEDR